MTTTTPPQKKRLTTSAMIASFADPGQKTASAPFGHALAQLAQERPEIVGLSADLAKYTDMHIFRDAHPQRFFQMGMAEQAMFGAAAGLAEVGLVPFASTYSVFATRRAYDFLCLDIAEPNLNVNIVGALPGLTTGYGPSHQATEDLAILRGCPNLTIVDPCDSVDIEQAVPQLADHAGPTRPTCGCSAGRYPRCSTSTATGSSWARPPSCAPAATSCSSPPA
jgi:transketolase